MMRGKRSEQFHKLSNEVLPPRGLGDYALLLGFKIEDLAGKRVLDLGAHKEETFQKELKTSQPTCEIVSLSPDFAKAQGRLKQPPHMERSSVAAVAESLPFKDNSFDYIFDMGGPSLYAKKIEDIKKRLEEMVRVLDKGGSYRTILVTPAMMEQYEMFKTLVEWSSENKVHCEITPLANLWRFAMNKEN